jgi:hypothetical protein
MASVDEQTIQTLHKNDFATPQRHGEPDNAMLARTLTSVMGPIPNTTLNCADKEPTLTVSARYFGADFKQTYAVGLKHEHVSDCLTQDAELKCSHTNYKRDLRFSRQ